MTKNETAAERDAEMRTAIEAPLPVLAGPMKRPQGAFWMFPLTRIVATLLILAVVAGILGSIAQRITRALGYPALALGDGSETAGALSILSQGVATGIGAVIALWVVGRFIERRTPQQYGLAAPTIARGVRDVVAGASAGAGLMWLIIAVFAAAGWYHVLSVSELRTTLGPFALALAGFFLSALFEEILFRAVLYRITEESLGTYIAIGLSAAFFGLIHSGNPNATVTSSVFIALEAGVLLAAAYALTRNVWLVTGLHWAWNVAQGMVFGAPVSGFTNLPRLVNAQLTGPALWTGGAFGPEAGLVACLVATAAGGALLAYLVRRPGGVIAPFWLRRKQEK